MKIVVKTPFRLNINGEIKEFDAGVHDVEKSVAEHWLVKHHTGKADDADAEAEAKAKAEAEAAAKASKQKGK